MIYIFSFIAGIINGFFASGAGQVLVFFLIYTTKMDTHKARATSLICTSVASLFSIINYSKVVKYNSNDIIVAILCGLIFGTIGAKIMKKINANLLNLISGLVIFGLSAYNIVLRLV